MHKILFVCLGNICRSPMAEYVLKDMVKRLGLEHEFEVASAATSYCEQGSDVHHGTRAALNRHGVPCPSRKARRIQVDDYGYYDRIICMDRSNVSNLHRILGGDVSRKISMLLDRDVADPWYTNDFESTYNDVVLGCEKLLNELK